MDQGNYDSNVHFLEEDELQPHLPAEPPAEQEEENLYGCGNRDIFEQDDPPVPSPHSSIYGLSQLFHDVNLPTP